MAKGLIFLPLLLLMLLAGLPLVMSMSPMPPCPQCNLTPGGTFAMCLAFLGLLALVAPAALRRPVAERSSLRLLLLAARPERPPRSR